MIWVGGVATVLYPILKVWFHTLGTFKVLVLHWQHRSNVADNVCKAPTVCCCFVYGLQQLIYRINSPSLQTQANSLGSGCCSFASFAMWTVVNSSSYSRSTWGFKCCSSGLLFMQLLVSAFLHTDTLCETRTFDTESINWCSVFISLDQISNNESTSDYFALLV